MSQNDVLAISLQGMQADMKRVEQIGMNMANALTPGYKRGVAVQPAVSSPFSAALDSAAQAAAAGAQPLAADIRFIADNRPGTFKSTGQSLDVAISGQGYFEVAGASGPAYTRQGSFHVDARGRLVTAQGLPVMGREGEIYLNTTTPVISSTGAITEQNAQGQSVPMGQLKVVSFDDEAALQRLGDGLMSTQAATSVAPDAEIQVRQGFLENANVDSAYEMTQLLQTMRHFESMNKIAQAHDDMIGSAIRKLGDV